MMELNMKPDNEDDRLKLLWDAELTILLYRKMVDDRYRKSMVNNYSSQSERNKLIHGIKKLNDGTKCRLEDNTV